MSNTIENINLNSLLTMFGNSQCSCNNSSTSIVGFDMAYSSLLNAIAEKERQNITLDISLITEEINTNSSNNDSLINNNISSNRVEVTNKDKNVSQMIENAINQASEKYGVDGNLIKSIIKIESNFNPNAVSSVGAKGLMQIMPFNYKNLGITDPFDIEQNINGGTKYIKQCLDMYDGNVEMALMAYNGGPTRMKNRGVETPEDIYKMPKETQNYVSKVIQVYRGN